jgi:hypothetical protein
MCGIGGRGGRRLIDKLILITVSVCRLGLTLGEGISCGVLMRVRGSGKSELGLWVGSCRPIVIVVCLGLSLTVWIIKSRSANHVRLSRISRTGMVGMTWEGIGGR